MDQRQIDFRKVYLSLTFFSDEKMNLVFMINIKKIKNLETLRDRKSLLFFFIKLKTVSNQLAVWLVDSFRRNFIF